MAQLDLLKKIFESEGTLFSYYYKENDIRHIKSVNVAQLLIVALPHLRTAAREQFFKRGSEFKYADVIKFLDTLEADVKTTLAPKPQE